MPPQYDDDPQTIDTSFQFEAHDTEVMVYDDQVTVTDLPTLDNDDPTTETVIGPLKRPPPPPFLRRRSTRF